MLTIREAQEKTGLSRITFQRNISNGTIRSVRQGNKFLVYEEDLHLLPKPRHTGVQQQAPAKTERFLQETPFPATVTKEMVEMKRLETIQMALRLAIA